MTNSSKVISDRAAISRTVLNSLAEHAVEIAPVLEKTLFPEGTPPNLTVAQLVSALQGLLESATEAMTAADLAHTRELADDVAPRALLDERAGILNALLLSLRTTLASTYGPAVAAAYGIPTQIPEEVETLLHVAVMVERRLRTRPLDEPPKIKSLAIAPQAVAEDLGMAIASLRSSLSVVDRERREAQVSQSAKNLAMSRWLAIYQGVATTACGLYALAGKAELADGIRPTARRLSGLPEEEDTAPSTERPHIHG
ncbi:hypothetical protein [Polyangium aurulentum]|uniref:hypothetical protein n=1 Tax=Polyangium aurulentum TaxID=2567896 RepID=UPI0010ADD854|nr:hypothetical protein [Polyangium aurulentum]UQA60315.1 hypothetical protein E8A73_007515 [Polyangium aurulentum]